MTQFELATKEDLQKLKTEILAAIIPLKVNVTETKSPLTSKEVKKLLQCKDSKLKYLRDTGKLLYVDSFGTYLYPREQFSVLLSA